jgi:hypothetical protein
MKIKSNTQAKCRWTFRLLASATCVSCSVIAGTTEVAEEAATVEETQEEYANWIDLTVGTFDISGDDAAFQRRWGNNGDFYGGIESFRLGKTFDNGTFTTEGHALFGLEDYDITLGYVLDDVGYLRGGYREFRTWYDGSGGYLPGIPNGWLEPVNDDLELDRGELWIEAGLRMENLPEITLRYSHQWREGMKDSTIWDYRNFTAVPPLANAGRGILPAYQDIDETRDTVVLDATHTLGNTDLGLGLRYEGVKNDNVRRGHPNGSTNLRQRDVYGYDLFGGHMTSETRFNERMMLSFGYAVTTMETDVDGSQRQAPASVYFLQSGAGDYVQNAANLNFWWNPIDDLVIVPSIGGKWEESEMRTRQYTSQAASVTNPLTYTARRLDDDFEEFSQALEFRYTGISDLVLYAEGEWSQGKLDRSLQNRAIANSIQTSNLVRDLDKDIDEAKYTIGANWYPIRGLSFASQYYRQTYDVDYDNRIPSVPNPGKFNDALFESSQSETDNFNVRMTWRALPNLTFVTRYDYEQTNISNKSFTNDLATVVTRKVESADIESHVISQSATWNATDRFYLQGSIHWISSETTTPANDVQPGYHVNWDNDYWSTSLSAGYVISKNTDLRASYYYFKADNYVNNANLTVPYGILSEEHAFTVTLTQWVTPQMAWNLRYGFFKGEDEAYGGKNDYDAHMVSTGLQFRF